MYTLKVFNSFFWGEATIKIDEIRKIEIEQFIDNFDLLTLDVDYYLDEENNLNCSGLREFQKIQIIETGLQDKLVFEGFIYDLQPNFTTVRIVARDYKGLLLEKKLFDTKNYNNVSLDFILNDILTDLNGRSAGDDNPEDWLYSFDSDVTGITKDFEKWLNYFDLLKELSVYVNKDWAVETGTIRMAEILGTDKTSGEDFTELIYNKNGPDENNISNISVTRFGSLKNTILTSITSVTDTDSKNEFWRLEDYNDISGDELTNELATISKSQKLHKFNIDFKNVNTEIKLGDKVKVEINAGIEFLDIEGDLFVKRRKVRILGGEVIVMDIDVSQITVKKTNFVKKINDIQAEVKKLQL